MTTVAPISAETSPVLMGSMSWRVIFRRHIALWALMTPVVLVAISALFAFSMFVAPSIIDSPVFANFGTQAAITGRGDIIVRTDQARIVAHLLFNVAAMMLLLDQMEGIHHRLKHRIVHRPVFSA